MYGTLLLLLPVLPFAFGQVENREPHGASVMARAARERELKARESSLVERDCDAGYWVRSNNVPYGAHASTLYLPANAPDKDGWWYICTHYMGIYPPTDRTPLYRRPYDKCSYGWYYGDSPDTPDTPDTPDSPGKLPETPELYEIPEVPNYGQWYFGCQ